MAPSQATVIRILLRALITILRVCIRLDSMYPHLPISPLPYLPTFTSFPLSPYPSPPLSLPPSLSLSPTSPTTPSHRRRASAEIPLCARIAVGLDAAPAAADEAFAAAEGAAFAVAVAGGGDISAAAAAATANCAVADAA